MRKIYVKILIGIIIILWGVYLIQQLYVKEGFTPKIREIYRPYIRTFNKVHENFVNNYGKQAILNKLRKWNIY